jgi:hypothetical protein
LQKAEREKLVDAAIAGEPVSARVTLVRKLLSEEHPWAKVLWRQLPESLKAEIRSIHKMQNAGLSLGRRSQLYDCD